LAFSIGERLLIQEEFTRTAIGASDHGRITGADGVSQASVAAVATISIPMTAT
jgi:hypothetical protein